MTKSELARALNDHHSKFQVLRKELRTVGMSENFEDDFNDLNYRFQQHVKERDQLIDDWVKACA
jgi:hypothetical protein